jgi:uncharacterized low-complexity protein
MSSTKKPVALAVGAALAGGLLLSGSAFSATQLAQGYLLGAQETTPAAADKAKEASCGADKKAEGKCGEGKCGMDKMDTDKDGKISKAEFAVAHDNDDSKFGAHDPDSDGFISAEELKAHKEGKCGEGKCGGSA